MKVTFVMRPDGNLFRGGAELMIEHTKAELEKLGVEVDILTPLTRHLGEVVHFFGCYDSHWSTAVHAVGQGIPYVCSPIYSTGQTEGQVRARALRHKLTGRYQRLQRKLLANANAIVVQTERELRRTRGYFEIEENGFQVVPHGVEERFAKGASDLFRREYGIVEPFVFSAGAFSKTKNQLGLIRAMKGTGVHLVLAGNVMDSSYLAQCEHEADDTVHFIKGIPYESDLLPSAYAAAQAFSLPSYNETFCMAAMEAAVACCPLVLGDRWEAEEIYAGHAEYVDPDNTGAIREATLRAFREGKRGKAEADHFLKKYRWDVVTRQMLGIYERVSRDK